MVCLPALVVLAGCGGQDGPLRFDLSGTVTYNGKPVPFGYIEFAPDTIQGNRGPGTSAAIRNGQYSTMAGRGTIGGPHVATIYGFDNVASQKAKGPQGQQIFNQMGKPLFAAADIKADLPKQTAVHDFLVPK